MREWVGHIDPQILKLYTHIADQASQDAMQRLAISNLNAELGKEHREDRAEDGCETSSKQAQA